MKHYHLPETVRNWGNAVCLTSALKWKPRHVLVVVQNVGGITSCVLTAVDQSFSYNSVSF